MNKIIVHLIGGWIVVFLVMWTAWSILFGWAISIAIRWGKRKYGHTD